MKETRLSREITQLFFLLVIIYFIIIIGSTLFIQNYYVSSKFNKLDEFYEENIDTLTQDEIVEYAKREGFTHTITTRGSFEQEVLDNIIVPGNNYHQFNDLINALNQFANSLNESNDLDYPFEMVKSNDGRTFTSSDVLIKVSLNSAITGDILRITFTIAAFTMFLFLIMIISVNIFINIRVGRPLGALTNYIDSIANLTSTGKINLKHNDEIKKIGEAIISMEGELNKEIVNRNELLRAITHELKTPLAHIVTLMFLHKNQVDEYADFEYVDKQVQNIISENNELIQITLNSLNDTSKLKQEINLKTLISKKVESLNVYLTAKEVKLDLVDTIIEVNPVPINLIINNLLLNAAKYSLTFLHVVNDGKSIVISNDFKDNPGSGVGKTIVNRLSEFENYEINVEQKDGVYKTTIIL